MQNIVLLKKIIFTFVLSWKLLIEKVLLDLNSIASLNAQIPFS